MMILLYKHDLSIQLELYFILMIKISAGLQIFVLSGTLRCLWLPTYTTEP